MHEAPTPQDAPRWACDAGTILGWRGDGVSLATGIRYAQAGRYQPPTPEPPATEPIVATTWAPPCPQVEAHPVLRHAGMHELPDVPMSEDCLRLSLTVPEDAHPDERLPVMVWVHGGSYVYGAGDAPTFDATALVRQERVIVVRVTYRLGLFGFLGSAEGNPANLGLLDLMEALRWVRRNIAAFGGDPENVTAFGESAGGDAIAHLMIAEGAEGLFRRAIIQSAPLGISLGRAEMSRLMAQEAARLHPDATAADVIASQARIEERVRGFGLIAMMPFGVQYGHAPLPAESEVNAAWERVASRIEVLIGSNEREVAYFTTFVPPMDRALTVPVVGPLLEFGFVKPLTWQVYGSGVHTFAGRHRRGGGRGYSYRFTWAIPHSVYAAAHATELPLLFESRAAWGDARLIAGVPWAEIEARGQTLRGIWAGFARSGTAPTGRVDGLMDIHPM